MTNYFENLDSILLMYRSNAITAYNRTDYTSACLWLYLENCAHPSKAFLRDMPRFTIRGDNGMIPIRTRLNVQSKAKAYFEYWADKLEISMADFREKNQSEYNRV